MGLANWVLGLGFWASCMICKPNPNPSPNRIGPYRLQPFLRKIESAKQVDTLEFSAWQHGKRSYEEEAAKIC